MKRTPLPWYVRQAASALRKKLPTQFPVVIRAVAPGNPLHAADIGLVKGKFVISIDPKEMPNENVWLQTLTHEYAHALTWHIPTNRDHPAVWGVMYAEVYCVVFGTR